MILRTDIIGSTFCALICYLEVKVFFMVNDPNLKDTMMDAASSETNDEGEIRILKSLP